MNEIQIFNNPQFGEIRTATNEQGEPMFCALDICNALKYANGRDALAKHVDEEDVAKRDTPTASGVQSMTYINESGLYSLIFGSKLDAAKQFKKWVTSEVLPSIRKTGKYAVKRSEPADDNTNPKRIDRMTMARIEMAKFVKEELRLNDASYLGLLQQIAEPIGMRLPDYVPSQGIMKSASVLLKEIGSDISAVKFNDLLIKHGYLETKTRHSKRKGEKCFRSITDKGLAYGQNMMNPKNQNETQPHWYADKFKELYRIVTA